MVLRFSRESEGTKVKKLFKRGFNIKIAEREVHDGILFYQGNIPEHSVRELKGIL